MISESGRPHVQAFWEYAAFLANSVVLILIGSYEPQQPILDGAGVPAIAILLMLVGRSLAIGPLRALFRRCIFAVDLRHQHMLVWSGRRRALALALSVPDSVPERKEIVVVAFAVVAFSIFVQALTMPRMIRRLAPMRP